MVVCPLGLVWDVRGGEESGWTGAVGLHTWGVELVLARMEKERSGCSRPRAGVQECCPAHFTCGDTEAKRDELPSHKARWDSELLF